MKKIILILMLCIGTLSMGARRMGGYDITELRQNEEIYLGRYVQFVSDKYSNNVIVVKENVVYKKGWTSGKLKVNTRNSRININDDVYLITTYAFHVDKRGNLDSGDIYMEIRNPKVFH